MNATPHVVIREYIARGFAPLPVLRGQKRSVIPNWTEYQADPADLTAFDRMNVGLLLGRRSGGLVDVDLDTPEAVRAAALLLPLTGMVSGRASSPRSHYWYKCPDAPARASTEFADVPTKTLAADGTPVERRAMLVELRSTGGQTVVAPSVHPGGEAIVWDRFDEPMALPVADLLRSVAKVAVVALMAEHWPGTGQRQNAYMALSGGLLRSGWDVHDVVGLVEVLADVTGDEENRKRAQTAVRTAAKIAEGQPATGWPKLAKILGARGGEVVEVACDWLTPKVTTGPGSPGPFGGPLPWGDPVPLGGPPAELPPFPLEHFTPWMAEWVAAAAAELQVPVDLPALLALGVAGAGIARKVEVSPYPGWVEPTNLFVMCVMPPGSRKSQTFSRALEPVKAIQACERERMAPLIHAAESEFRVAESRVKRLETELARELDPEARAAARGHLAAAREELQAVAVPAVPVLLVDDDTPAMLASELCRQGGRLLAASPEAKGLENITHDHKADLDIYLKGHAGDDHTTGRISRGREGVDRTALSLAYTPQPCVLEDLGRIRGMIDRGFMARWLYAVPASNIGRRDCSRPTPAIPHRVAEGYRQGITALWRTAAGEGGQAVRLTFCPEAVAPLNEFRGMLEPRIGEGGDLRHARNWTSKLGGVVLRLAGILHCADAAARGQTLPLVIQADVVRRAVAVARDFCLPHALAAFDCMGATADVVGARVIFRWMERRPDPLANFTQRECFRDNQSSFRLTTDTNAALNLLTQHDLIRRVPAPARDGPGRPSSPEFEVNPRAWMGDRNDRTPPRPPTDSDAGYSVSRPETSPPPQGPATGDSVDSVSRPQAPSGPAEPWDDEDQDDGGTPSPPPDAPPPTPPVHTLVADPSDLPDVAAAVVASSRVGLDVETTGLDPRVDNLCLLSLATDAGVYLIDCTLVDPAPLWPALAAVEVVGHNLAFDLQFLARRGFTPGRAFDTMLASQLLEAGDRVAKHTLKAVAARHLGVGVDKAGQRADWSGPLTPAMLAYAAADARLPGQLRDALLPKLAAAGLGPVMDLENAALPAVAWAAGAGVGFDRGAWQALADGSAAEGARLRERLDELLPGKGDLFGPSPRNWDAPAAVRAAFGAAGVTLDATDDDTLAAVDHPAAAALREYRGATKLGTTYGVDWLKHASPGGRVHCRWNQSGTMSGRMSCSSPNLQNLPRDPRYRRCFAAPPGRVLVKADYSQIELRLAASLSGDRAMIDAYARGDDLHALTARQVLGKADVTKADRQTAKAVNFGLLFGAGAGRLAAYARSSYGVAMTEGEAAAYRRKFFAAFPGLKRWHRRVGATGDRAVETRTVLGRRRSGVTSYTEKLNSPVQGSAADGLKAAIGLLWERRGECPTAVPVLFVHDEVVVEVDEAGAEAARAWLVRAMTDGMRPYCDPVPVEVEVTVSRTWGGD
jgi:DNA polymerase-1